MNFFLHPRFLSTSFIACLFLAGSFSMAEVIKHEGDDVVKEAGYEYLVVTPEDYDPKKEYATIFFLHGAGERGDNLDQVLKHGPFKKVKKDKLPFLIVAPQCPKKAWWDVKKLNQLFEHAEDEYNMDSKRLYLTGLSMGGFGTWHFASYYPKRFAAIAPICGGGDLSRVKAIRKLPIWAFHGKKDKTVPIEKSQEMVDALKKVKSDVKFTVYPDGGHNVWTETYNNPELYEWFLQHD